MPEHGRPARTLGVSLKLYLDVPATLAWVDAVVELCARHPSIEDGEVELWILPTTPLIPLVAERLAGTRVRWGAQNLSPFRRGPYTGEVSGEDLAQLGCAFAELGHAERRRLFGEDDAVIARKLGAARDAGLTPVLCVGEAEQTDADAAAELCLRQLRAVGALGSPRVLGSPSAQDPSGTDATGRGEAGLIVAYEPLWAIGAPEPAPDEHIVRVCAALREAVRPAGRVVYGGAAGVGLLPRIGDAVDGLFLGRFAHDPRALRTVVDEAAALAGAAR